MDYKIISSQWFTPPYNGILMYDPRGITPCIGVVAIETDQGKWKAYIGYGAGRNEGADQQLIAGNGAKLTKAAACGHFPDLPAEGFVY